MDAMRWLKRHVHAIPKLHPMRRERNPNEDYKKRMLGWRTAVFAVMCRTLFPFAIFGYDGGTLPWQGRQVSKREHWGILPVVPFALLVKRSNLFLFAILEHDTREFPEHYETRGSGLFTVIILFVCRASFICAVSIIALGHDEGAFQARIRQILS
jgi:hypothetical protein